MRVGETISHYRVVEQIGGGQRFLMVKETPQASDIKINVVANWFEELKRLVPVH
jgi:hypothetical protein